MNIVDLEPKSLWNHFSNLNAVPRASKKEQKVIAFIQNFGTSLGLPTQVDDTGNVIIKKPATAGMENRTTVVLQSHLDMVHQKNADTQFDFDTQGIDMFIDNGWVRARGTTLGADNGIGVATIMAILESTNIPHPAIEALFTIDEETGMTGALGLKGGLLDAKIMLNLDTEDDTELTIGCAGGVDVTDNGTYDYDNVPTGMSAYFLQIKGLTGGHSGMDIHLGRGNANKLLVRILNESEKFGIRIQEIDGGGLRNAIPREANAVFFLPNNQKDAFEKFATDYRAILKQEYKTTDPNLELVLNPIDPTQGIIINSDFQNLLLRVLQTTPNGIFRMSPDIDRLVQTSNNLARVLVKDGQFTVQCLTRSSVDTEKDYLANIISAGFELLGGQITQTGSYPGWTPNPESDIVRIMSNLYKDTFSSQPHVNACHAGLECGILGTNYPGMEMISFGPNIRGAHSPDEKVEIASVQKFWGFLLQTLEAIPTK